METTLSIREVAEQFQVDHSTVHRWVQQGHFPGARKAGPGRTSPFRIPKSDVVAFAAKHELSIQLE
ncbi:MAG: helix-turn-helix domain-containing protein [Chloroflexi bacterium]|nr:helix-turn-helix domain-containing protein [Chloroflexota bacterium]